MHTSVDDIAERKADHQKHEDRMQKLEAAMHKSVDDNVARYGENQKTLTSLQAVMATDPINRAQQQEQANVKHAADSAALRLKIQETEGLISGIRAHVDAGNSVMNERIASIQAVATAVTGGGQGGGGGGRPRDPLAVSKVFNEMQKISGEESHQQSDDWYQEVRINIDLVIPMASELLDWALKQKTKITQDVMNGRSDLAWATGVSKELYS